MLCVLFVYIQFKVKNLRKLKNSLVVNYEYRLFKFESLIFVAANFFMKNKLQSKIVILKV